MRNSVKSGRDLDDEEYEDRFNRLCDEDPRHASALLDRMDREGNPIQRLAGVFMTAVRSVFRTAPQHRASDHEQALRIHDLTRFDRNP